MRELSKPPSLTISGSGSVAMIVGGVGSRQILIERADGFRQTVWMPTTRMLAQTFTSTSNQFSNEFFPEVTFHGVRMSADGTLFASIRSVTDEALLSTENSAFTWHGSRWQRVPARNAMPLDDDGRAVGVEVAAVDTLAHAAFNGIYGIRSPSAFNDVHDPNYLQNQAEFVNGTQVFPLGIGTATGIRGTTVVGFQAGLNAVDYSCRNPRRTYAVQWRKGAPEDRLGNGVTYDVNIHNEVVGDNEFQFGTSGQPVLWRNGKTIVLDKRPGSAYAIADDGTIVGAINDSAFIADVRHPHSGVQIFDGRLRNRTWHIIAAYGIARSGRVLAIARQRGKSARVVVLDPL